MPTIIELEERGLISRYETELDDNEYASRRMFFLPRIAEKLEEALNGMQTEWNVETPPIEQFYELAHHFITGGALDHPRHFHIMQHRYDGIWELKTADLRLFGWFPMKDTFICTDVANANVIKREGQYSGYCEQAGFRRNELDLDEPKFLKDTGPHHVVSNSFTR